MRWFRVFCVALLLCLNQGFESVAWAATPKRAVKIKKSPSKARAVARRPAAIRPVPGRVAQEFLSGFGLLAVGEPAVVHYGQYRWRLGQSRRLYLGPDIGFALFTEGYSLAVLVGTHLEWSLHGSRKAHLTVGAVGGPVFSRNVRQQPDHGLAALAELGVGFVIGGMTSIRGQLRTGIVGGSLAFSMATLVGFQLR